MKKDLSMVQEELVDQYQRAERAIERYKELIVANCQPGYISIKEINGKKYHYLQWRDGEKLRSKFIPDKQVEAIKKMILIRKEYESSIKKMMRNQKEIEKFLGKDILEEYDEDSRDLI